MKEPSHSDARKTQKESSMRRAEVEYLRFLRTKERPENFSTLKIIGKGAFGEVKLVQRNNDGKIYALKSLVKQEMVSYSQMLFFYSTHIATLNRVSSRKINLLMFGLNVIFSPNQTAHGLSNYTPLFKTTPFSTCLWSSCQAVI